MSVTDFVYDDFQLLSYEEFYDLVWEDVSEKIVSTDYLESNKDFIGNMTYDLFRMYQMNDCLTIRIISRMLEVFFFNSLRFNQ